MCIRDRGVAGVAFETTAQHARAGYSRVGTPRGGAVSERRYLCTQSAHRAVADRPRRPGQAARRLAPRRLPWRGRTPCYGWFSSVCGEGLMTPASPPSVLCAFVLHIKPQSIHPSNARRASRRLRQPRPARPDAYITPSAPLRLQHPLDGWIEALCGIQRRTRQKAETRAS